MTVASLFGPVPNVQAIELWKQYLPTDIEALEKLKQVISILFVAPLATPHQFDEYWKLYLSIATDGYDCLVVLHEWMNDEYELR